MLKAIGVLPSDPQIRQMNDAQWLWCYFNIQEDEEEEEESWKNRLDYLTWFINPEMAKSVHEQEARKNKKDSRPIGSSEYRADEAVFQSDEFALEAKAAALGYNPDSGLTPREFLLKQNEEKEETREIDIMNDDFETLIASGEFKEVADFSDGAGDPFETFDEFLYRAQHFEDATKEEWDLIEQMKFAQENIGIESLDELQPQEEEKLTEREKLLKALDEQGLTEDDLDIFEVDDDSNKE